MIFSDDANDEESSTHLSDHHSDFSDHVDADPVTAATNLFSDTDDEDEPINTLDVDLQLAMAAALDLDTLNDNAASSSDADPAAVVNIFSSDSENDAPTTTRPPIPIHPTMEHRWTPTDFADLPGPDDIS